MITDVTLRDGLQMEKPLTTEKKFELLQKLVACSFKRIEFTSFSHPKWMPQFADSEALCEKVFQASFKNIEWMAFVPNARGLERAQAFPIPWFNFFVATSETFNQKNVNQTIDETLRDLGGLRDRVLKLNRKARLYVSTVFGCPYEKEIPRAHFERLLKQIAGLGFDEVVLSDTIGVALPPQVTDVIQLATQYVPVSKLALHLHNTYGLALANAQAGFEAGIRQFDGSFGGLGGCPYAKGATGNLASDLLKYFFARQHLETFSFSPVQEALQFLTQQGFHLNSPLSEILSKGGQWYGV